MIASDWVNPLSGTVLLALKGVLWLLMGLCLRELAPRRFAAALVRGLSPVNQKGPLNHAAALSIQAVFVLALLTSLYALVPADFRSEVWQNAIHIANETTANAYLILLLDALVIGWAMLRGRRLGT